MDRERNVVVVGGGLAGLTAAAYAARAGARVTVLEGVSELGGRARVRSEGGYRFNMGPHALYKASAAAEILGELGIAVDGADPPLAGAGARCGGQLYALPSGFVSLLTTGLLSAAEKLETGRFLAKLGRLDTAADDALSLREVIDRDLRSPRVRQLAEALVRLTSYAHMPEETSGGAAMAQVQTAFDAGVSYLHGGWAQLVHGLRDRVLAAGAEIRTGARVAGIERRPEGFAVTLQRDADAVLAADAVVLAIAPKECVKRLGGGELAAVLRKETEGLVPVRKAGFLPPDADSDLARTSNQVQFKTRLC